MSLHCTDDGFPQGSIVTKCLFTLNRTNRAESNMRYTLRELNVNCGRLRSVYSSWQLRKFSWPHWNSLLCPSSLKKIKCVCVSKRGTFYTPSQRIGSLSACIIWPIVLFPFSVWVCFRCPVLLWVYEDRKEIEYRSDWKWDECTTIPRRINTLTVNWQKKHEAA